MTLKLIALDIDGTLTNDEKKITEDTRSTLLNSQKQGVRVMLASARPVPGLYSAASELRLCDHHGILMAYNGGKVIDATDGQLLSQTQMECIEVDNLADFLDFSPIKLLLSVDPTEILNIQDMIRNHLPDDLCVVRTAPFYLEIIPVSINKGKALLDVCSRLCIDPADTATFGDSENDIPMLQAAGCGVAMGNAEDAVKAVADKVTLSNNSDGIAHALRELIM